VSQLWRKNGSEIMPRMTKAQARKRLLEASRKVFNVSAEGHMTLDQADKIISAISRNVKRLK